MDASEFETHFQSAVDGKEAVYRDSRDKILEAGSAALPLLDEKTGSAEGWRTTLTASIIKGWITNRSAYEQCTGFAKGDYPFQGPGRPITGEHGSSDRSQRIHSLGTVVVPRILEMISKTGEYESQTEVDALMSALVAFKEPDSVPPVREIAESESADSHLRVLAITVLGEFDRDDTRDALLELLMKEENPEEIRGAAATELAELKDPRVLAPVETILTTEHAGEELKLDALMAMSDLADPRGVSILERLFQVEKNEVIIQSAVETLGEIGDSSSIGLLERIRREHSDEDIHEAVEEAIETLRSRG